ncbi:hypothetical protein [Chitinophaga sp.]|uniref:hypothetical protein n=1 Tax=Chitinophaga sp. TaxID=1869181 RepID=UPI0031D89DB4
MLPDEFEALSLQQLQWYVEGVRVRDAQRQEPFRLLYHLLYNANAKKGKSFSQIAQDWPLYTDSKNSQYPAQEDMNQAWERLKSLSDGERGVKSSSGK